MGQNIDRSASPERFIDYPSKSHREDYGPAREYLAERAPEASGLKGLYEYGSVAAPGISDIDLIAVIDEKIDNQAMSDFLTGAGAPPAVVRVLDHGTIKPMSANLFERIQILGEISAIPLHASEPITPTMPGKSTRTFIDAANVVDWLPERILMLRSLLNQPLLSCRRVLGGLGSFRHSATTVTRILGYEPSESALFSSTYDDLRSNWFDQSESQNFDATITLINSGISTGQRLIPLVTERLLELGVFKPNDSASGSSFWLNSSRAFFFGEAHNDAAPVVENHKPLTLHLPPPWLSVFQTYGSVDGVISALISSNIELPTGYSHHESVNEFDTLLVLRMKWINESFEFLNPLGFANLMYRFSHLRAR